MPLPGTRVAVLGAGGAARAVVVALASSGAHVTVHARNRARGRGRRDDRVGRGRSDAAARAGSWDLLVNCTPVGMYPHVDATPIEAAALTGRHVYDLVYNPTTTRLLREAAKAGCQTIGGLEMLVGAGARAVRVVDRREAAGRRHAGGRAEAACGVHAQ